MNQSTRRFEWDFQKDKIEGKRIQKSVDGTKDEEEFKNNKQNGFDKAQRLCCQ
ncbi:unnamed protein product [Paramecium sonneborni]|uniref:Uncharacterized protein n=1 Tax=Paramecium sonneborni TaxID=65129 RepID=A0A8S1NAI0_9CILI|nr:unnamed protein product [Paramecium sonneborni]